MHFCDPQLKNTRFVVYLKDMSVHCYKKFSKRKTCQNGSFVIIFYEFTLEKKLGIMNLMMTKMTCIMRKNTKLDVNSLFIS